MNLGTFLLLCLTSTLHVCSAHNPFPHDHNPHHEDGKSGWKTLNNPKIHHTGPSSFTITTPPATDIWRPNVTADNFTAPYLYTVCKSSSFKSISVRITADWKTRYDQGGIAIFFPEDNHPKKPLKWVKTGIEFENGAPQFGTVGTYAFSDWSLAPIRPEGTKSGKFLVERSTTEMWVYAIVDGERQSLREVTWAFLEERGKRDAEIWVGVYAAKPTYSEGRPKEGLTVEFEDLEIDC